jgi:hypothetical protein
LNLKKTTCLTLFLVLIFTVIKAQRADSSKIIHHFSGLLGVTNNGISIIPTFSLGKPALSALFSIGNNKWSFDPELRFSINGKPWGFVFWARYKLFQNKKWRIGIGAHPAYNYRPQTDTINGTAKELLVTRRYAAAEFAPSYFINKNITVGLYYLYSHGLDDGTIGNTNFITINSSITNIKLSTTLFLKINPQLYYLKLDARDGIYVAENTTLYHKKLPFNISTTLNKVIKTTIIGSKDFVWNVSLNYTFNKKNVRL